MDQKLKFIVIDDSEDALIIYSKLLEDAGHNVVCISASDKAIETILKEEPDCVLCDLMLPGKGGLELFKELRKESSINQPNFIIISGKQFEYDQRQALDLGVDAYLTKPIKSDSFVDDIMAIIDDSIKIRFWGCRGSLAVPGKKSVEYGGNTNCVTVNISNKHNFIFDAGTGIKELSNHIMKENLLPYKAKFFLTHPHYDHINGIPFFVPLYIKGNEFEFYGADQGDISLQEWLNMQMDSIFFPVTMKEFLSSVSFHPLTEQKFDVDGVEFHTLFLNHPGDCLGYKMIYKDKIFCYITDNELYLKDDIQRYNQEGVSRLIRFIQNCDVLVIDSTYTDEEYRYKIGWGHSPLSNVVDVADKANAKLLCLYHHDPDQTDDDITDKLNAAVKILQERQSKTKCIAPKEGDEIII